MLAWLKKRFQSLPEDLAPERQEEIRNILINDLHKSSKVGLIALGFAAVIFLVILYIAETTKYVEYFFGGIGFLLLNSIIYLFWVEKKLPPRFRMPILMLGVVLFGAGFGSTILYYTYLNQAKENLSFIATAVVISGGVLAAASSVFGASKATFRLFALCLVIPPAWYLMFQQYELAYNAIGVFFIFLTGTLWVVNRLDFKRRVELILLQFVIRDEKEKVEETLTEVQTLKKQQDGDYFLTSLLIEPLSVNRAKSSSVEVDFLLKEKKTFVFRKWAKELGGDINISHNIWLGENRYTVFLNADAMGKSIQGAGGALVLGTVFQSILFRFQEEGQDMEPEEWLRHTFDELHRIFESFDGSMLVSLVMGLVDEATGFTCYLNAEHPFTVLYRDKKASFLEKELKMRKLGTIGFSRAITIDTIQLEHGDVLIAGTDGRDDILYGMTDGIREINEDETEFLRRVEEGEGNLDVIYTRILDKGEITDDLGLLSVKYIGDSPDKPRKYNKVFMELMDKTRDARNHGRTAEAIRFLEEAESIETNVGSVLAQLARLHFQEKNYEKSGEYCLRFLKLNPGQNKYLYLASYCYKKLAQFNLAAKLGNKLFLREPQNIENLVNLIDVHIKKESYNKAKDILSLASALAPEDKEIHKLQQWLHESGKI